MLETLGMRNLLDEGEECHFSCPLAGHLHGDAHPSAYMNKETTAWICHGCHEKGNAISFLQKVYNITALEATSALRKEFDNSFKEPATSMKNELEGYLKASVEDVPVMRYLDDIVVSMFPASIESDDYLRDRGFTPDTIADCELGYDEISGRVTIPVRDDTGRLVGIKGRDLTGTDKAKYLVLGDLNGSARYGFPTYEVSNILFGIARYTIDKCEKMILCEGEFNAISLWQNGIKGAVAIGGSHLSNEHIKNIKKHANEITLFFDSDNAGYDVMNRAIEELQIFMPVNIVPDHDGDPNSMSEDEVRQCLNDAKSSLTLTLPLGD